MRFLVDAQLPPALARHLSHLGHDAEHVADVGLQSAPDLEVWRYATTRSAALITKDEDFVTLRALRRPGPAVLWVRIGNSTSRMLIARFVSALPAIIAALEKGETILEVL